MGIGKLTSVQPVLVVRCTTTIKGRAANTIALAAAAVPAHKTQDRWHHVLTLQ